MTRFNGKVVLITGGTSGIGLTTARLFREEGAQVIITGRDPAKLASAQNDLGDDTTVLASDTGSLTDIDALIEQVASSFGHLDVLFLNAGIVCPTPIGLATESQFDDMVRINFKGAFFLIQKALPILSKNSSIILSTSITNQGGTPNFAVYGAVKAAQRCMVKTLGIELISRGIRVNAVSPSQVATPGFSGVVPQERITELIARSPIKRLGRPEEIAKVVLFLASDDASYIVGEEIIADGGMSL